MSTNEQRVVAGTPRPLPPRPNSSAGVTTQPPSPQKGKEKRGGKNARKVLVIVLILLAAGAGFFGAKLLSAPTAPGEEPTQQPTLAAGDVQQIESLTLNLAGGHYLRLGVALQLAEGSQEVDEAKVHDTIISVYSGRAVAEVTTADGREALRDKLAGQLAKLFPDEVIGVYLTDYVTQ